MVQRILVTAGAAGIGLSIARAFVDDGARVHIADIDAASLRAVTGRDGPITGSVTDVSDPASVDRLLVDVQDRLGGLDVLVNNAGISGPTAPMESYDPAAWAAVIDVNLNGTFHVTQRAIPLLKASGQGSIIIMSSLAGRFGYANRVGYATTKWGLVGLAKTLAMELGPHGITCNTIHPGAVDGARIQGVLQGRAEAAGTSVQLQIDKALANQSIKRFTDPADIAALAVFLAGKHARTLSGQMFPIDGDSKSTQ